MKLPAFQFYPADWLRDPGLRSCSLEARGLWIDILAFMHAGTPYGHLRFGEKDILPGVLPAILARMVGSETRVVEQCLAELEAAGVFSRTETGTIYSRRMVRDQDLRLKRAQGGRTSLKNPNVPRPKTGREGYPSPHPSDYPSGRPSGSPPPPSLDPSSSPSLGGSPSSSSSSSSSRERKEEEEEGSAEGRDGPSVKEILEQWNQIPGAKLVKFDRLTSGRGLHKRISVLTRQHKDPAAAWAWWDSLFRAVEAQKLFLFSGANPKQWVADLPWVLGPENLAKVLERRYEDFTIPTRGNGHLLPGVRRERIPV